MIVIIKIAAFLESKCDSSLHLNDAAVDQWEHFKVSFHTSFTNQSAKVVSRYEESVISMN